MLIQKMRPGPGGIVETSPTPSRRANIYHTKETAMQWETPTACDFRFGFEITMYIATR